MENSTTLWSCSSGGYKALYLTRNGCAAFGLFRHFRWLLDQFTGALRPGNGQRKSRQAGGSDQPASSRRRRELATRLRPASAGLPVERRSRLAEVDRARTCSDVIAGVLWRFHASGALSPY